MSPVRVRNDPRLEGMRFPITPATTLWRELRDEVRHNYPGGRIVLAVDSPERDASAAFADGMAEIFAEDGAVAVRASIGAFGRPRAELGEGAFPYDVPTFRRVLIDPFRDGAQTGGTTGFQLAAYDSGRDAPVEAQWATAPRDAVLIVDGTLLQSESLRGVWNWSVWLDLGDARGRDGESGASALVDDTDPSRPRRVYRDFC